jgi:hypothetical protein
MAAERKSDHHSRYKAEIKTHGLAYINHRFA